MEDPTAGHCKHYHSHHHHAGHHQLHGLLTVRVRNLNPRLRILSFSSSPNFCHIATLPLCHIKLLPIRTDTQKTQPLNCDCACGERGIRARPEGTLAERSGARTPDRGVRYPSTNAKRAIHADCSLRRERDSNPRCLSARRFSRPL